MTRIIYVVYTREYLTSRQIIGANLKKYAFLCDYSEVKIDDLIDSPMYSTPMQVVSISPCESLADTVVNGIPLKRIIISTINNIKYAPIVQRIEHRPPKSGIQVQVLLGARREL